MESVSVDIAMSLAPVIHYIIMVKIYDGFVYKIPEKRRNFIYLLPMLYPLLFKIMHYSYETSFFKQLSNINDTDIAYFTWIFGLNILLVSVVFVASFKKEKTPEMAEPVIVDAEETVKDDAQFVSELSKNDIYKRYTLKQEILFYVIFLALFFSIATPFILGNNT